MRKLYSCSIIRRHKFRQPIKHSNKVILLYQKLLQIRWLPHCVLEQKKIFVAWDLERTGKLFWGNQSLHLSWCQGASP